MASRGLPGFLRRSIRQADDDDYDEDSSARSSSEQQQQQQQQQEDNASEEAASGSVEAENGNQTIKSSNNHLSVAANDKPESADTLLPEAPSSSSSSRTATTPPTTQDNGTFSRSTSDSIAIPPPPPPPEPSEHSQSDALISDAPSSSFRKPNSLSDSWQHIPPPEQPNHPSLERQKSYKETQFDKVLNADVVNLGDLRKLGWNGVPPVYRGVTWKLLLGYLPTNAARREQNLKRRRKEYRDAIAQHYDIDDNSRTLQEQETLRQVLVDVPRTAPDVPLFRNDRIRRILTRLLYIWAMRHPASSYVQGINDLATPLLVAFLADYFEGHDGVLDGHVMNHLSDEHLDELEADVYWCLTNLLAGIQDHYTSDQPGVQRMVLRLEELVNRIDANLCQHFRDTGVEFLQFAFKWMNCLLLREFSLKCVLRLWDTYISEKDGFEGFHVYVCAAFLCQFSGQLQEMPFDDLFCFMQALPTSDWTDTEIEVLLSQAYVLSTLFGGSDAHLTSMPAPR